MLVYTNDYLTNLITQTRLRKVVCSLKAIKKIYVFLSFILET